MTQRRIFAFLWPDAPQGPVDDQARQVRYLRVSGRGPLRMVLLVALSLLTFGLGLVGILVVSVSPTIPALAVVIVALAILVPFLARCWQVGTYVNDHGVRIIWLWRTIQLPWSSVTSIDSDSRGVTLQTRSGAISTHIASRGMDYLGRPEVYVISRDRLTNWWQAR